MDRVRDLFIVLMAALSLATLAQSSERLPGEAEYRKAVPIVEEIERRMTELVDKREPGGAMNEALRLAFLDYMEKQFPVANDFLRVSIAAGNPAAEYRLGLILDALGGNDGHAEACELFKSAFARGFTPAGLQMRVACFSDIDTPEYIAQVKALPELPGAYGRYYPQPTTLEFCAQGPTDPRPVQLDERGFRANLYYSMRSVLVDTDAKDRSSRLAYPLKSREYGCARMQGWLERQGLK